MPAQEKKYQKSLVLSFKIHIKRSERVCVCVCVCVC